MRARYARKKSGPGRVISLVAASVVAVAAAGIGIYLLARGEGGSKGSTPEDLFAEVQAGVLRDDWSAFYDAVLPSVRRKAEADWKARKQSFSTPEAQVSMAMLAAKIGVEKDRIS